MKKLLIVLVIFFQLFILISCTNSGEKSSNYPSGKDIAISYKLIANNYMGTGSHKFILTIENKGEKVLESKNWELYFSHAPCRHILKDSVPAAFKLTHINGDFFKITPTDKFTPLKHGEKVQLPLISDAAVIKYTDTPGGFYFVFTDDKGNKSQPEVATYTVDRFESNDIITRGPDDHTPVPTPAYNYTENAKLTTLTDKELPLIIPTPAKAVYNDETVNLTSEYQIHFGKDLKEEANYLADALGKVLSGGVKASESNVAGKNIILLEKKNLAFSKSKEAYSLIVSQNGIIISANDNAGVFYGVQSLRALLPVDAYAKANSSISVRTATVEDDPQFVYRGMHLDVSRNFHTKESVLKLLDALSFYKINTFRMHIGDDEGWRLAIQELPELTEVSSKRGHTLDESDKLIPAYGSGPNSEGPGSGFYTRADFQEILKYAKQRHINVIPALDIPGHARAAIKAMDARYNKFIKKGDSAEAKKYFLRDLKDSSKYFSVQLFNDNVVCPCQEGTYNFLQTVFDDIKEMYNEAGAPLQTIHIGGDEVAEGVWIKSPECEKFKAAHPELKNNEEIKHYFFKRVTKMLETDKLKTASYEDIAIYKAEEKGKPVVKLREDFPKSYMQMHIWNNVWGWGSEDIGYRLANDGYPVVLSNVTNLYFDLAYNKDPDEPGFYWGGLNDARKAYEYTPLDIYKAAYHDRMSNPISEESMKDKTRLTAKGKSNILGLEGLLWSETVKGQNMMEWYIFPKIIAAAERAWAKTPAWANMENREQRVVELNKQWNVFVNALGHRELPRLDYLDGGFNYYIPIPGAVVENGTLKANVSFPGLTVRYTTDGTEPTASSPAYEKEVSANGTVKLATFTRKGRMSRVVTVK